MKKILESKSGYGTKFFHKTENGTIEITVGQYLWLLENRKGYYDCTVQIVEGWIHLVICDF